MSQAKVLDVERLVAAVQVAYATNSSVVLKKDKTPGAQFSYMVTLGKNEQHVGFAQKRGSLFSFFDTDGAFLTEVDISEDDKGKTQQQPNPVLPTKELPRHPQEAEDAGAVDEQETQTVPEEAVPEDGRVVTCRFCLAANLRGAPQCRKCGKAGGLVEGMPTVGRAGSRQASEQPRSEGGGAQSGADNGLGEFDMTEESEADRAQVAAEMEAWKRREEEERLEQLLDTAALNSPPPPQGAGLGGPTGRGPLPPPPQQQQYVAPQQQYVPPPQQQPFVASYQNHYVAPPQSYASPQQSPPPPLPESSPPPAALRFQKMPAPANSPPPNEVLSPRQRRARDKAEKKAAKERAKRGLTGSASGGGGAVTPLASLEAGRGGGEHVIGEPFNFQHLQGSSTHFQDPNYLARMGADAGRLGPGQRPPLLRSFSDSALEAAPAGIQPVARRPGPPPSAQPTRALAQPTALIPVRVAVVPQAAPHSASNSGRLSPRRPTAPSSARNSPQLAARAGTAMTNNAALSRSVPHLPLESGVARRSEGAGPAQQGPGGGSKSPRADKPWSSGTYTDPRTGTVWVYDKAAKAWQKHGRVALPQQQQPLPPPVVMIPQHQHQPPAPLAQQQTVLVLFDFPARHPSHLSVVRGERVALCPGVWPDSRGWTRVAAERMGVLSAGLVPESYLRRDAAPAGGVPLGDRQVEGVRAGPPRPTSLDGQQRAVRLPK